MKLKTNEDWLALQSKGVFRKLSTPMEAVSTNLLNGNPTKEAAVVVVTAGDRILFQQRRDTLLWTLPGGSVENGETAFQAAIRELKEETNIDADDLKYLGNGYSKDGFLVHAFSFDFRQSRTDYSNITSINDPDQEALRFIWARPGTGIWQEMMDKAQHPNNIALKLMRLQ